MEHNFQSKILEKARLSRHEGKTPLVILDIDDTLIDCRYRKQIVLKDFANHLPKDHRYYQKLISVNIASIHYLISDTLKAIEIEDKDFEQDIYQFWLSHYFSYDYLIQDQAFPGAVNFVNQLLEADIKVVYLTARHESEMGAGTREYFRSSAFPFDRPETTLILKPDRSIPDAAFKASALKEISSMGDVVASFENELKHLNEMAEYFPSGLMYWRDTLHSPNQPVPHKRVTKLPSFV
ncbi:MAG: hypothetical protein HRU19_10895 [Pseudobacteriovorax sp.]|nr:hypothetical protein [Pseudobacteriovorax sp.]